MISKKLKSIADLKGRNVMVDHDWFMPNHDSLGHFQVYKVLDAQNLDTVVIDESVPYGSTNSRKVIELVNNEETLINMITKRSNKILKSDKKKCYKAIINDRLRFRVKYLYYNTIEKEGNIVESLVTNGYYITTNGGYTEIYCEDIKTLVKHIIENSDVANIFFSINNENDYGITRYGLNQNNEKVVISPSTREGYKYQLTMFKGEKPYGHLNIEEDKELQYWIDTMEIKLIDYKE